MVMVSDAISHSIVPGIVIAFLITGSKSTIPMMIGAIGSGAIALILIHCISASPYVNMDAALGVIFSTLFAFGILLINLFADYIDLDTDCVLFGDIAYIPLASKIGFFGLNVPIPVIRMIFMCIVILLLILLFSKEIVLLSFDPILALTVGLPVQYLSLILTSVLVLVIVNSFESLGSVLVIALLVFPGVTSILITRNKMYLMIASILLSLIYPIIGVFIAIHVNCSISGAIAAIASFCFFIVWIFVLVFN